MPFPASTTDHDGQPAMAAFPPGNPVHVVPMQDAKEHIVSLTETCWCTPQTQDEAEGYTTVIHKPIRPVVPGHTLDLRKVLLTDQGLTVLPR